jgi:uncharacterized protein (DUF58 family)
MRDAAAFRAFQWISRWSRWSDERLTRLGRLSVVLLIGATIFATDPSRTSANVLVAILVAVFVAALFGTFRWRPRLRVHRELPPQATVGIPLAYKLRLANDGLAAEANLEIRDRLARRFPTREEFEALRPLVGRRENWFDRRVGFLSWVRTVRLLRGGEIDPTDAVTLPPRSETIIELSFTPLRRGRLEFSSVEFARPDPCGLMYARHERLAAQRLTVIPRIHPMPAFEIPAASGAAPSLRTAAGSASEFHALREFRVGDPRRHIHWRASAKRGVPVVKQFVDGRREALHLMLDAYALPVAFEQLLEVAASVLSAAARYPEDLAFSVVDPAFDPHTNPVQGPMRQYLHQLAHLAPATEDVFAAASGKIILNRGAALIFLTSHWDRARQHYATELSARAGAALTLVIAPPTTDQIQHPGIYYLNPADLAVTLAQVRFSSMPQPFQARAHA